MGPGPAKGIMIDSIPANEGESIVRRGIYLNNILSLMHRMAAVVP